MAAVIRKISDFYQELLELRDPRTKEWFLCGSPWPIITLLIFYWYFVFKIGPAMMKNRKPFNLDTIIQIYNAAQVVICSYLVYQGLVKSYGPWGTYNWLCEPVDVSFSPTAVSIARSVHIYFLVKVLDLMDTVFFVLRKKQSQVTFLHVYHHMGMAAFAYLGALFLPGGQGVLLGLINCFVHSIMYSYYFITIWNPEYKKYIWWKKYITQLQIAQFFIIAMHQVCLISVPYCGYPHWPAMIIIPQFIFFTALFVDFYFKTYK